MMRWVLSPSRWMPIFVVCGLIGAGSPQQPSVAPATPAVSTLRAVLNRYCAGCHNNKVKTAGLAFDSIDVERVAQHPESWEKVIRRLRARSMPPAGLPRPDEATYSSLAAYLETTLDVTAAAKPNPGNISLHRLNRSEYSASIKLAYVDKYGLRLRILQHELDAVVVLAAIHRDNCRT